MNELSFMNLRRACKSAVVGWTLLVAQAVLAQGIVVDDLRDNSGTEPDIVDPLREVRFESGLRTLAPIISGNRAELKLNYQWSLGGYTGAAPAFPERQLGWSLTLTVLDPGDQGFELIVDSGLRGVLGVGAATPLAVSRLPEIEIWMYEMFATTPRLLSGLGSNGTSINTSGSELVDRSGNETVGRYRGTQSFLFYMAPLNASLALQPFANQVAAWQQFGRPTADFDLAFMNLLPSGVEMSELGQRLRFTVNYAAQPVPEPATWLLLAGGTGFMLLRRRRIA